MAKLPGPPKPRTFSPGSIPLAQVAPQADFSELATYLQQQGLKLKEKGDRVAVEEAYNKLLMSSDELTIGEDGYKNKYKSGEAVNSNFDERYNERLQQRHDEILSGLNRDQAELFAQRAPGVMRQFKLNTMAYRAEQVEVYDKETWDSTLSVEIELAARDPNNILAARQRLLNLADDRADDGGMDDQARTALKLGVLSTLHSAVIERAIADKNFTFAKNYMSEAKNEMDRKDRNRLTEKLTTHQDLAKVQEVTDDLWSRFGHESTMTNALAAARKELEGEPEIRKDVVSEIHVRWREKDAANRARVRELTNEALNAGSVTAIPAEVKAELISLDAAAYAQVRGEFESRALKAAKGVTVTPQNIKRHLNDLEARGALTMEDIDQYESQMTDDDVRKYREDVKKDIQIPISQLRTAYKGGEPSFPNDTDDFVDWARNYISQQGQPDEINKLVDIWRIKGVRGTYGEAQRAGRTFRTEPPEPRREVWEKTTELLRATNTTPTLKAMPLEERLPIIYGSAGPLVDMELARLEGAQTEDFVSQSGVEVPGTTISANDPYHLAAATWLIKAGEPVTPANVAHKAQVLRRLEAKNR